MSSTNILIQTLKNYNKKINKQTHQNTTIKRIQLKEIVQFDSKGVITVI